MEPTRLVQSTGGSGAAARTALKPTHESRRVPPPLRTMVEKASAAPSLKPTGYGLPCAECKTYYLASLSACPICKSPERVSPTGLSPSRQPVVESEPDVLGLDEERERFLREFKAKLYAVHTQINPNTYLRCAFADEDDGAHESATVCKTCHDHLQARVDLFEVALHMDLKEAAQVIYEAVWADTSDSNKTYQNAAQALLEALRQRAGMKLVLGRLQPLAH
jgi:hypothetical protein